MTSVDLLQPGSLNWLSPLKNLFKTPPRLQVAALCYRKGKKGPEVLLVTSRGRGRWILPKGWPELKKTGPESALNEAFEEAGVVGSIEKEPFAICRSVKGLDGGFSVPTKVAIYCVKVDKQLDQYPEKGQREIAWVSVSQAIKLADEPNLKRILKRFKAEQSNKTLD